MATIDTSWHPVAVPDAGGSAFLSYSSALRDSANKLLENVVSQRQKDRELAQIELRDRLANNLAVAKLVQDAEQNEITNAFNEKKFAESVRQSDEDRKLKKEQLEIDRLEAKLKAQRNALYEAKMLGADGTSGLGKLPTWMSNKNEDLPFGVDGRESDFFFDSKFYKDLVGATDKYAITTDTATEALSGYTPDQWNKLKSIIKAYENTGWWEGPTKSNLLLNSIGIINNGYNQAKVKRDYEAGKIQEIMNNQEARALFQKLYPSTFLTMMMLRNGQAAGGSTNTANDANENAFRKK